MADKQKKLDYTKVIDGLKAKWFKLAELEKLGKTKFITKRLDALEKEIAEFKSKQNDSNKD